MDGPVPGGWTAAEQEEIWARWRRGESLRTIARSTRNPRPPDPEGPGPVIGRYVKKIIDKL